MTKSELSAALRKTSNNFRAEQAERIAASAAQEIADRLVREIAEWHETYLERAEVARTERELAAYNTILAQLDAMKARITEGL